MAEGDGSKGGIAAADPNFQRRVKYYMQKGAIAVLGEDDAAMAVGEHDARKAYADEVLDGTASVFEMTLGVTTNATIAGQIGADGSNTGVTDANIEFTVNSMWNDFSGYEAP